jgi:hypothetical protein
MGRLNGAACGERMPRRTGTRTGGAAASARRLLHRRLGVEHRIRDAEERGSWVIPEFRDEVKNRLDMARFAVYA